MKKLVYCGLIGVMLTACSLPALSFDVYLTRHFEKQSSAANPGLTEKGKIRAEALAQLLADKQLTTIYSTDYHRTKQTAQPLATRTGKDITLYNPADMRAFIEKVKSAKQTVLIVGHSNTTPVAIKLLGGEGKPIKESEYGELFKVVIDNNQIDTSSQMVSID